MAQIPGWDLEEVAAREDAFVALVDKSIAFVVNKVTMQATDVITAAAPPPVEEPPPTPPPPPLLPLEVMGSIPVLWAGQVTAELLPFLGYTFTASAAAVAASIIEAYPNYDLPPVSDVFAEEYLASAANRLVGIGDAVWATMRQELVTGFSEGESIPELAARLQLVAGITEPRAHVIARTEVISASNIGSITQAKISGLVGTKSWEATNDERTRCTHRAADGQTVDLEGKFKLGGLSEGQCGDAAASYLDVPGDPTGPPGEVIQCRCTIIYDLDLPEEEPVVTAAAQVHTGAMIALRMTEPDARVLEIPGYEDADELHTTFLYLGEAANFDDDARENILDLIAGIAGEYDPITTSAFAVNVFNPHKTDVDTALVLGIEGGTSGIVELKELIETVVTSEYAIAEQHTPWVPHVTIAYTDDMTLTSQLMERLGPITYDRLRVAFAGDVYDMPLGQVLTASDFNEADVKRDNKGRFAEKEGTGDIEVDITVTPASSGATTSKLTNAVIYGKYKEGETIATSTDGKTRLKYEKNKIAEYEKIDGDWKLVKTHTKGGAYKDVNSLGKSWYMGDGPAPAKEKPTSNVPPPPTNLVPPPPTDPTVAAPPVKKPIVATPAGIFAAKDSYIPGEVALLGIAKDGGNDIRFLVKTDAVGNNELMAQMRMSTGDWKDVLPLSSADQIDQIMKSKPNHSWSMASPGGTLDDLPASPVPNNPEPEPVTYTAKNINGLWFMAQNMPKGTVLWTTSWKDTGALQGRYVTSEDPYTKEKTVAFEEWSPTYGQFTYGHQINSQWGLVGAYSDSQLTHTLAPNIKIDPNVPTLGTSAPNGPLLSLSDAWVKRTQFPIGTVVAEGKFLGSTNARIVTAKSASGTATIFQLQLQQSDTGLWVHGTKFTSQSQLEDVDHNNDFNMKMITPHPADGSIVAPYAPTPTPPTPGLPGTPSPGVPPDMTAKHKADVKDIFAKSGVKWHTASSTMLATVKKAQNAYPQYSVAQLLEVMDGTTKTSTSDKPFTDKIKKYLSTKAGKHEGILLWGGWAKLQSSIKGPQATNANTVTPSTTSYAPPGAPPIPANLADFSVLTPHGAAAMQTAMANKHGAWTAAQQSALTTYTGGSYTAINNCLRGIGNCLPHITKTIDDASKGMRPLTKAVRTFRGSGWGAFGLPESYTPGYDKVANLQKLLARVGGTVREPGFLSTSITPNKSFGGSLRIEVYAPEGTPAAYVKSISLHPTENELLLDHNLEYKIVEVIPQPGSYPEVLVRLEVVVP